MNGVPFVTGTGANTEDLASIVRPVNDSAQAFRSQRSTEPADTARSGRGLTWATPVPESVSATPASAPGFTTWLPYRNGCPGRARHHHRDLQVQLDSREARPAWDNRVHQTPSVTECRAPRSNFYGSPTKNSLMRRKLQTVMGAGWLRVR